MENKKEVEGNAFFIGETQTFGSNGFRKRDLVVVTEEQYPQKILIEFVQNSVDLLDSIAEGQKVRVSINLRGREWVSPSGETKYFNSIQAWKLESLESERKQSPAQEYLNNQKEPHAGDDFLNGDFESKKPIQPNLADMEPDDLPF